MSPFAHYLIVYAVGAVVVGLVIRFVRIPPLGEWRSRWRRRRIERRIRQQTASDIEKAWLRSDGRRFNPIIGAFEIKPPPTYPPARPVVSGLLWPVIAVGAVLAISLVGIFLSLQAAGIASFKASWEE